MLAAEPRGLPLQKILPQYLKDLGYVTRAVGKWHLGFYRKEFTPVYRGFDSHLGYWTGSISYYDHIVQDIVSSNRNKRNYLSRNTLCFTDFCFDGGEASYYRFLGYDTL
jgi:arylsulfatase A-like enzyme